MNTPSTHRVVLAALVAALSLTASAQDPAPLAPQVVEQIATLQAEKAGRNAAQKKMDSHLIYLGKKQRGEKLGAGLEAMEARLKVPADGVVLVDITAKVSDGLLADLRAAGATIVQSVPRFDAIRAKLPLARIEEFAGRKDVKFIKRAAQAMTRTGPVNSEGDIAHGANAARPNFTVTGAGVKIGVISDSVDNLLGSQATGELPDVTVLEDLPGESGEGTAMLEIVHDIAPGAQLFFATAFISDAGFAQNILNLRAAGCDIIVDDIFYFNESPFQNGPIAQAVEQVSADGALYFSAAGNEGNKSKGTSGTWEGNFVDGGATAGPLPLGHRVHNFGGLNYNTITSAGFAETLFWTDPLGASANDYDLYVLNSTGTSILEASTTTQNGAQDPFEITFAQSSGVRLVVVKHAGEADRFLHLGTIRGELSNSTNGTVSGHSACPSVFSVAAVDASANVAFTTANPVEDFSSDGPRRFFFYDDGTPITPGNFSSTGGTVLSKPDIAAADGVATSVPGFAQFYGTSAAAPHAAALAALIKSQNLSLTPAQVTTALLTGALDIEQAGDDGSAGLGIIRPAPGLATITAGPKIIPQPVTLLSESFSPANSAPDPGEQITVSLGVKNDGSTATTNLTATLLAQDGVTEPSGPAAFGAVPANGTTVTQNFTLRTNGPGGGTVKLTFLLRDGAVDYGVATKTFMLGTLGAVQSYSNSASIIINDDAPATPFPSTINVAGATGSVGKVTVRLNDFTHTFPYDLDILLVGPGGRKVLVASGIGGETAVQDVDLTFDDAAAGAPGEPLVTGTYLPTQAFGTDIPFFPPAPDGPYSGVLAEFIGGSANGTWSLFVQDVVSGDAGVISGGWSLFIQTVTVSNGGPGADVAVAMDVTPTGAPSGDQVVYSLTVYNNGPAAANNVVVSDVLPAGLTYSDGTVSQGSIGAVGNTVTANLGTIVSQGTVTMEILANVTGSSVLVNTATVTTSSAENNATNNSASASVTVGTPNLLPTQPAGWSSKLVVSNVAGTNTDTPIAETDPVFVDFAFTNNGTFAAPAYFVTTLVVDNVVRRTYDRQLAFPVNGLFKIEDLALPPLGPGPHTIRVVVDAAGAVDESNESDNTFARLINGVDMPPTISVIADTSTNEDVPTPAIAFTINDDLTFQGALVLGKGSSDTDLVPLGNIYFGGSGPDRTVMVVPAADRIGSSTITITVTDESNFTATETFVVTVGPVNDAPSFTKGANQTVNEDAGQVTVATWATAMSPGPGESGQTLSFLVGAATPALFSAQPAITPSGTLTFTPAANANGSTTVTVSLMDDGGTANGGVNTSAGQTFTITILSVNDAPSFVAGPDIQVLNDDGPQSITGWAGDRSPGPTNEAAQGLSFNVLVNQPALFTVVPSISSDGTLTFTPAVGASGAAVVTVTIQDTGGTANGGSDTSAPQTFVIGVLGETQIGGSYTGLALAPDLADNLLNGVGTNGLEVGNHNNSGLIAFTGNKKGTFTSKLTVGGKSFTLKGAIGDGGIAGFGSSGSAQVELKRKGLPSLVLSLRLSAEADGDHVRGTLLQGAATVGVIDAGRTVFSKTAPPPAALRDAANKGKHTLLFPARGGVNNGLPASLYPQGDGYATLTVDKKGGVKIKGVLADGAKFSAKATLDASLNVPVYALLYKKTGSLLGQATFADVVATSDVAGDDFVWFRPNQTTSRKPPAQYPAGWPNGIMTDLVGSRYVAPPSDTAALPGLTATDPDGNALFTAADGGLPAPLPIAVNIDGKSKVQVVLPGADALKLKIDPKSGLVKGSFKDASATKTLKPAGAILQKQQAAFGYFLGGTQGGGFTLAPK